MIAFQLFQQILILFLIMALGFALVKLGFLKSEDSRVISILCVYLITPCVNLNAFQIDYTPEILHGFLDAMYLAILLHVIFLLLSLFLKKCLHATEVERLSVIYPNAGNLVIPLVTALFGSEWVIYSSAYICVQVIFLWTHARSVMSGQAGFDWRKIFLNVNLISAVAGLLMFLTHWKLPLIAAGVVQSVAGMVGPMGMIMIGMLIAGSDLKKIFLQKRIYLVAFMRLIGGSLVGIAVLKAASVFLELENEQTILMIVLLALITPSAATITQLAQLYHRNEEYSGAINVLTTLLCIFTMPLMIALFSL